MRKDQDKDTSRACFLAYGVSTRTISGTLGFPRPVCKHRALGPQDHRLRLSQAEGRGTGGQDGVRSGKSEPVIAEGPQPGLFSQVKEKGVSKWDFLVEVGHRGFLGAEKTQVWSQCSVRGVWQDPDWEPGLLPNGVIRLPAPAPPPPCWAWCPPGGVRAGQGPTCSPHWRPGQNNPGIFLSIPRRFLQGVQDQLFKVICSHLPHLQPRSRSLSTGELVRLSQSATEEDSSTEPGGAS